MPKEDSWFTGKLNTTNKQSPLCFKAPPPIDTKIRAKENMSDWLRKACINQLYREGELSLAEIKQYQRDGLLDLD